MSTVAERIKRLLELLSNDKVRSIVLFGESGVGKTWTARKISSIARKKGLIGIALWVFLSREYGGDTLRESIAYQLSLHSINGESEVEDDNEETEKENQGDLQQQMSMILAGKKLLLVLDDEGTKMDEQQIMTELKTLLNLENKDYKVLITKRNSSGSISSEYSEREEIEVKPLSEKESLSLLRERAGTGVCKVPGIEAFVEKTKHLPAAIVFMAKALNYSAQQVSGVEMFKFSPEEESGIEIYNLMQLLCSGYDLVPNSVLLDCCRGGRHFFRDCWRIHYSELIAYWMMEGYLGPINNMQKAYEKGHQILMELIDYQLLKKLEPDYVIMERSMPKFDDVLLERGITNLDDCYRLGFGGIANLGLANALGNGNWEGFGRIAQNAGLIKEQHNCSTLLLDCNSISLEFPHNFSEYCQQLQVLAIFNPALRTLSPTSLLMPNLYMLVLRGCHFLEKIDKVDQTLMFEKLTVLEISGSSSLTTIPDEFFKHMPQLQSLNLSAVQIDYLPSSLYELRELGWLILRGCSHLKALKSFKKCKRLMVLDLSGATSLERLGTKNFSQNQELQVLNFSKTKIKVLPLVNGLQNLTHLLLSGCLHLHRMRGITQVNSLQVLDLSDASKFEEFHDPSLTTTGLKILDLSGTSIVNLPSKISNPSHLYLKGCTRLENLQCVETLTDLEALDISEVEVRTLPSLSHLHNLRRLSASCCLKLEKLPDLNPLKKLEVLDLSGCIALTKLQDNSFEQMSCLWRLDLSETKIKCLPSVSNLRNLRHLLLKKCTDLQVLPQLESLSKIEELNLCGINVLRAGVDCLRNMIHLQILDLSETPLQHLPSMSNLKNLRQLYLRGCRCLKAVPNLESLTRLEVLDLSGAAIDRLPSLKSFSNLRKLLLRDCPGLKEFRQQRMFHLPGATVKELAYGISESIHWEQLDQPNMKDTQGAGSSRIKETDNQSLDISISAEDAAGENNKCPVSVNSSQFLELLRNNRSFHFSVHPIDEQGSKGASVCGDDFMFRDIYFQTRWFSDFKEQQTLEIHGFQNSPMGIEEVLCHANCALLIDMASESCLSDRGASNLIIQKGCLIDSCRELESVFVEEEEEKIMNLRSLEVLRVSNSANLKHISFANWQSDTFQNLKQLYLDCCPKLSIVFSSSQLPIKLEVLHIKFCDELEAVFEQASQEPKLPCLGTLCLWELPKLKTIGCALPSLQTRKVWRCPNLSDFEENVRLNGSIKTS